MIDIEVQAPAEEEESDEFMETSEDDSLTFDDIVSFAMLMETTVTLFGITIFFIFFVLFTI